ncbi:Z1 domain-containing protein [Micromonospora arida]|uniref:Z1 domain-containing protein n=1 Tax=Micromonospora arida TaxID=2203715 RepID=UPI003CE9FB02
MNEAERQTKNIALQLLRDKEVVTSDDVTGAVRSVVALVALQYPDTPVDQDAVRREVESLCNVWVPTSKTLEDNDDHIDWLDKARPEITWNFWERYERYLEMEKGWAPALVRRLGEVTDDILGRFEQPTRPGKWDRRGMVVGQVQSGKTANYTGLICKAADAGYRLVIVLAGLHNSLRSQTQQRLDREFLGFDTRVRRSFDQGNARVGVGAMKGPFLYAHSLTSSDEKGDFQKKVASQVWVQAGGGDPVLLVVKKNASVLKNLYNWATDVLKETDPETGRQIVRQVPLLVIDDEADNASVNTKNRPTDENGVPVAEYDPTAINGWIRRLLHTFEKSAYLGYTATPFANIFIDEHERTQEFGEDLFPRSFIKNLQPPTNYTGVTRVFGLDEDAAAGLITEPGLPVVRSVADHEAWMPDKHRKDHVPAGLPASLVEAVNAFLLATAVRKVRGQDDHNSMLVHVSRFTAVQAHLQRNLRAHLEMLTARVRYGDDDDGPTSPWAMIRTLWENDSVVTTSRLLDDPSLQSEVGRSVSWEEVRAAIPGVLDELRLVTMNGKSEDALVYTGSDRPLTVIAVGGDKLSRGLTLEGLTVSYYLRASKMYDTLMQMGRWFGYRPRYLDVCRLYTTDELAGWYRDIAVANEELLREFDYMAVLGKTPKDYGLRVRAHPDGLMITAAAKMRNGETVDVTFSQTISETITFDTDEKTLGNNFDAATTLLTAAGEPTRTENHNRIWDNVATADILAFLDRYRTPDTATKARPQALAEYIRTAQSADPPELTSWTVALLSLDPEKPGEPDEPYHVSELAGHPIRLLKRATYDSAQRKSGDDEFESRLVAGRDRYVIRRLVSPEDEYLDLREAQKVAAEQATVDAWHADPSPRAKNKPTRPGGLQIREQRSPQRGLLLLYPLAPRAWMSKEPPPVGIAISFPKSAKGKKIRYRVTNLWWQQEYGPPEEDAS